MDNFSAISDEIHSLVKEWEPKLMDLAPVTITQRRNSQNRTIKQILGHLVDSGIQQYPPGSSSAIPAFSPGISQLCHFREQRPVDSHSELSGGRLGRSGAIVEIFHAPFLPCYNQCG